MRRLRPQKKRPKQKLNKLRKFFIVLLLSYEMNNSGDVTRVLWFVLAFFILVFILSLGYFFLGSHNYTNGLLKESRDYPYQDECKDAGYQSRGECYANLVRKYKDVALCDKIDISNSGFNWKSGCYFSLANITKELKYCSLISGTYDESRESSRVFYLDYIQYCKAVAGNNPSLCYGFKRVNYTNTCLEEVK